jgi:DNA-binding transcriptional LysR family regulator
VRPTEAGARFLEHARRLLAEVDAAERDAAGLHEAPRGELAVTAPVVFGRLHVLPVVLDFLDRWPEVTARLALLDRTVSLVEEGFDVAVRIGRLPDSSLIGARVGSIRRIVCASPAYLAAHGTPATPADLKSHRCVAFTGTTPTPEWGFAGTSVRVRPHLVVDNAEAAVDAARAGLGVACVLGYQAVVDLRAGRLAVVLERFEPEARPVHLLHPAGRSPPAKVRTFLDAAVPRLREVLAAERTADGPS